MNKFQLIEIISDAFKGTHLGNGIGLWEGQAIDDYETEEVRKKNRDRDEKVDWSKISSKDLYNCESSLSFFDADGMRFHIPAFMIAELKGELNTGPIYSLAYISDYSKSQFSSLSNIQRMAIRKFLLWCLSQDEYKYDKPQIELSLKEYWREP